MARPYNVRLALGIFFGILGGLLEPAMVVTVMFVYSVVFQDAASPESAVWWKKVPEWLRDWLMHLIHASAGSGALHAFLFVGLIPFVFLLRGIVGYLNLYLLQWVAIRSITDLRVKLFRHLLNLPASFFADSRSGDLMSRVLTDTEAMRNTISASLTTIIKDPVTLIATFAMLFWAQPKVTAICLLVFPLCIFPLATYSRKARRASTAIQRGFSDLYNQMIEGFAGQRILKAYNLEDFAYREFKTTAEKFISNYMRMIRASEISGPMLEIAGALGFAFLLGYLMQRPDEKPDASAFLGLVMGLLTLYKPIKSIVRLHSQLEQARAGHDRVMEIMNVVTTLPEPANPKPLQAEGADIEFKNVSFAYKEKRVLQNVNLSVKAGSMVALVGASGSGKTTLTNLLLRFYDPVEGSISIGGVDIRDVLTKDLRDRIAVVTQETILFNETIRNNIAMGRPGASDQEILVAAKHAHADEFIQEKPGAYNFVIGERGVNLSGGQRQRLAIARAIVKDAPILVLDEATSALDTESERVVQAALEELMQGRTTICIAHRLSTIQKADVIVAMADGRIVETGTHAELLARGGVYSNLYKLQFKSTE